jgi:excisionase family DNA binding protein
LVDVLHQVLLPTQIESGARWHANRWGVAEERLCTEACESILTVLDTVGANQRSDKGRLVVACVEGEQHSFPGRATASDLRGEGWEVNFLGADVPADELRSFVAARSPDAVLLSCTLPANLIGAARSVAAVHDARAPVLVGGAAFGRDEHRANSIGADAWATTAHAATDLLDQVLGSEAPTRTRVAESNAVRQAHRLAAAAPLLADIASGALSVLISTDRAGGVLPWIQGLLRTVAASVLVGDEQLVYEKIDWLVEHATARGESPDLIFSLLSAVATALPEGFAAERHVVRRGMDRLGSTRSDLADGALRTKTSASPARVASSPNETARLAALVAHVDLASEPSPHMTELVELAATVCEAPIAFVSFVDDDSQRLWAVSGEAPRVLPRSESICARTILQSQLVVIPDLSAHPDFATNPLVANEPRWRFYAGLPIIVSRTFAIGTFAVVDFRARTLTSTQGDVLKSLATEVALQFEVQRYRADHTGDAQQGDQDRMARLLANVIELRKGAGEPPDRLLSSRDVARLFGVSTRTVANWAASGHLQQVRTAGGHYRFLIDHVLELLLERDKVDGAVELEWRESESRD